MNKSFSFWVALLIGWIFMGTFLWQRYLCDCWSGNQAATVSLLGKWTIQDGSQFKEVADEHFQFLKSGATHISPLSISLRDRVEKTANYLVNHQDKSLIVTGFYDKLEDNPTILPNLGLGRANEIKSYLVELGVPSSRINISSTLTDVKLPWFKADTLMKGIDFTFAEATSINNRLDEVKARLCGKPMSLYFATNQNVIDLSDAQRTDIADMIYVLDNIASSGLSVGGHTDNQGKPAVNQKLSQERADFVGNYLVTNGNINLGRINAKGFGAVKPAVPNTTKENKALNRRVEIILTCEP